MNFNPDPERKVALTFLAHPDDAEILCAGTLIRLAAAGWEIHLATATAGDCGSATVSASEIAACRRQEGERAARLLDGVYHCLEEKDVNVVFDKATNRKAIDFLRGVAPTLVITHPRNDYMLDHEQVHLLARNATFSYAMPNASSLPLLDGSQVPWLYYCDPVEGLDPYSGQLVRPSTYVDISDQMEQKIEALACHASQRAWLRFHHGMDEYVEAMKRHCQLRGGQIGVRYAEALVQHRGHAYPSRDLLRQLFG